VYIYWVYGRDCWLHIAKKCMNFWIKQEVGILLTNRGSNNFKKKGSCVLLVSRTTAVLM